MFCSRGHGEGSLHTEVKALSMRKMAVPTVRATVPLQPNRPGVASARGTAGHRGQEEQHGGPVPHVSNAGVSGPFHFQQEACVAPNPSPPTPCFPCSQWCPERPPARSCPGSASSKKLPMALRGQDGSAVDAQPCTSLCHLPHEMCPRACPGWSWYPKQPELPKGQRSDGQQAKTLRPSPSPLPRPSSPSLSCRSAQLGQMTFDQGPGRSPES